MHLREAFAFEVAPDWSLSQLLWIKVAPVLLTVSPITLFLIGEHWRAAVDAS